MKIPLDDLMEAIESDSSQGFCLSCGNRQSGCEPDARNYICESCEEPRVFGAEEILIMGQYEE